MSQPRPGAKKDARDRTADERALANLVELDLLASDKLKAAFAQWKGYRTERATRPLENERRAPWTERAAELARDRVVELAARWGEAKAIECITHAINRRWLEIYGPKDATAQKPKTELMTADQLKKF